MSARRGSRLRRKPTPVYQVEDTRASADESDAGVEERHALATDDKDDDSRYRRCVLFTSAHKSDGHFAHFITSTSTAFNVECASATFSHASAIVQ